MWASGDYQALTERLGLGELGARLVNRVGAGAGTSVLDVATGTGSVALAAAARGANVWGVDLTRPMLVQARRLAGEPGLPAAPAWVQGDALALPFGSARFDRVLSCLGVVFATDDRLAADEMVRVCRRWGDRAVPLDVGRHRRGIRSDRHLLPGRRRREVPVGG